MKRLLVLLLTLWFIPQAQATGFKSNGYDGCGLVFAGGYGAQISDVDLGSLVSLNGIGNDSGVGEISAFCEVLFRANNQNMVLGIRGSYGIEDNSPELVLPGAAIRAESNDYVSVTGKLGWLDPTKHLSIYAIAGYGKIFRGNLVGGGLNIDLPNSNHFIGGIGTELFLTPNMALGLEGQQWYGGSWSVGGVSVETRQTQFLARFKIKATVPEPVVVDEPTIQPQPQPEQPVIEQRPLS